MADSLGAARQTFHAECAAVLSAISRQPRQTPPRTKPEQHQPHSHSEPQSQQQQQWREQWREQWHQHQSLSHSESLSQSRQHQWQQPHSQQWQQRQHSLSQPQTQTQQQHQQWQQHQPHSPHSEPHSQQQQWREAQRQPLSLSGQSEQWQSREQSQPQPLSHSQSQPLSHSQSQPLSQSLSLFPPGAQPARRLGPAGASPSRAKYRAILGEFEELNRLLETTAAARDGDVEALRDRIADAEAAVRERDSEIARLREKCAQSGGARESGRVAQAALQWLRFLIERIAENVCGDAVVRAETFDALIEELHLHAAHSSLERENALCARAGNEIVDIAKDVDEWRARVAALEAENAQLLLQLRMREGEEHQLQQMQWLPRVEEQNALLLAERDRQAAWITELEQQLRAAQRDQEELVKKSAMQAVVIHRHERVLDLLTGSEQKQ